VSVMSVFECRPVGSTGQLENLHSDHSESTLIGIVSE